MTWIILQQQGAATIFILAQLRIENRHADAKTSSVRHQCRRQAGAAGTAHRRHHGRRVLTSSLRGVNLLGGETHTDVTITFLAHNVPNTTSTEVFRNVLSSTVQRAFSRAMIRVAPDAQKTDAKMACNTLLMSDDGEFSAKPELEIFADDVQCGHGATVASILTRQPSLLSDVRAACRGQQGAGDARQCLRR